MRIKFLEKYLRDNYNELSNEEILCMSEIKNKSTIRFSDIEELIILCMDYNTKQTLSVRSVFERPIFDNDFQAKIVFHKDGNIAYCITEIVKYDKHYYRIQSWLGDEFKRLIITEDMNLTFIIEKLKNAFFKQDLDTIVKEKFFQDLADNIFQSLQFQYSNKLKIKEKIDDETCELIKYITYENNVIVRIRYNNIVFPFISKAVITSFNTNKWENNVIINYGNNKMIANQKIKEIL